MKYALINNGVVFNTIIAPEGYSHDIYEAIEAAEDVAIGWLYDGTEFAPPVEETTVPYRVSKMQAKLALNAAGLLETVTQALESGTVEAQIYWQEASHFHRDHPVILSISDQLGLTSQQVDDLFVAASQIV